MPNTHVFTLDEINQILEQLNSHPGARLQYIGSRYVPIFGRKGEDSIEWDKTGTYEPLTIVLYQGNSYTSRQFVPAGIEITNKEYWAETGNYNAQIEQYRQEVLALSEKIKNTVLTFDTFSDLANYSAEIGGVYGTKGFYEINDGGASLYVCVSERPKYTPAVTQNEKTFIPIEKSNEVILAKYGVIGNYSDSNVVWNALKSVFDQLNISFKHYGYTYRNTVKIIFPQGKINLYGRLHIQGNTEVCGAYRTYLDIDAGNTPFNPTILIGNTSDSGILASGYDTNGNVITDTNFTDGSSSPTNPPYYYNRVASATNVYVHDLTFYGNEDCEIAVCLKNSPNSRLKNISVHGAYSVGFFCDCCWSSTFENLFSNNRSIGIAIADANSGTVLKDSYFTTNANRTYNNNTLGVDYAFSNVYGPNAPAVDVALRNCNILIENVQLEGSAYPISAIDCGHLNIRSLHCEQFNNSVIYSKTVNDFRNVIFLTDLYIYVSEERYIVDNKSELHLYLYDYVWNNNVNTYQNFESGTIKLINNRLAYSMLDSYNYDHVMINDPEIGNNFYKYNFTLDGAYNIDIENPDYSRVYLIVISDRYVSNLYVGLIVQSDTPIEIEKRGSITVTKTGDQLTINGNANNVTVSLIRLA